jgi:hypothetical protein
MNEYIGTVLLLNKAVALALIKPLNGSIPLAIVTTSFQIIPYGSKLKVPLLTNGSSSEKKPEHQLRHNFIDQSYYL